MLESNLRQSFLQQFHGRLQPGLAALAGTTLEVLGQAAEGGKLLAHRCLGLESRREKEVGGAMKDLGCVLG